MAIEAEKAVMREIGLGAHYSYYNGSGSCAHIRRDAVRRLPDAASNFELTISPDWLRRCKRAKEVDQFDGGQYSLTNTWVACAYAIQDAIYRQCGDKGFSPPADNDGWVFFYSEKRKEWNDIARRTQRTGRCDLRLRR